MQHNGAVNSNAPVTAEDGYSLASREGLWQRISAESTLARAARTPSSRAVVEASIAASRMAAAHKTAGMAMHRTNAGDVTE
jgi:hypothetical protein